MTDYEKKIAERTLKILEKKSWNKLSLEEIIITQNKKKININSKNDLLKIY